MNARNRYSAALAIPLLLALALSLAACAGNQPSADQAGQSSQGGGEASGGNGQASGGEGSEAGAGEEGGGEEEAGEGEETGGDDFGLVALACPKEPVPVKLAIAHTFNWSPNRETNMISIDGTTEPNAWCMLTIAGSKVTAEPCNFSYHYEGFLTDGEAMCQLAGDATAALEITGRCKDGRVSLELSEYANDDGLTGKLYCPEAPPVDWGCAYPPSRTQTEFAIAQGGDTVTASRDPDETHSFSYDKSWTLIFTPDVFGE